MHHLLTPAQASSIIAESIVPLPEELLYFLEATGRVLREPLIADRDFPPYDRVMMDGIACRSQDLPGPLQLAGLHPAGATTPLPLAAGHCWQIMTGATLPKDCDTIIPVEELELQNGIVSISQHYQPRAGAFIHRQGVDCLAGKTLVAVGNRLGPAEIGIAATVGNICLRVTTLPRVVILSTGDELISPNKTPAAHQMRQSNGATLFSALLQLGIPEENIRDFHLHDDFSQTLRALEEILSGHVRSPYEDTQEGVDLLLITGGISKGERDFIRPALEQLIGPPSFHGVAQRPGKPLAFWAGSVSNPPVFALPGNPNSTLTTFHRYVKLGLDAMLGTHTPEPIVFPLASAFQPNPALTLHVPASLSSAGRLILHQPRNSGDIPAILQASGFAEIPPSREAVGEAMFRFC